jgi:hypothetical protein
MPADAISFLLPRWEFRMTSNCRLGKQRQKSNAPGARQSPRLADIRGLRTATLRILHDDSRHRGQQTPAHSVPAVLSTAPVPAAPAAARLHGTNVWWKAGLNNRSSFS